MADSNNLDIKITTTAEGDGVRQTVEGLQEVKGAAVPAGQAIGDVAKSAGQLEETGSKLGYHTLREAAHAMHGVETAAEGGHMSTLRWVMSLRGLYELLVANPWTALLTVLGSVAIAIGTWAKKTAEAREEAEKEFGKIVDAAGSASAEMNKAAADVNFAALKASLDEIKEKYAAIKSEADAAYEDQNKLAGAETALKLAKMDLAEQNELRDAGDNPEKQLFIRQKYAQQRLDLKNEQEADEADRAGEKASADADRAAQKKAELEGQRENIKHLPDSSLAEVERLKRKLDMPSGGLGFGLVSDQTRDLAELQRLQVEKNPSLKDQNRLLELQLNQGKIKEESESSPTYEFEKKRLTPLAAHGDIMARNQLVAIGELVGSDKTPGAIKVAEDQRKKSEQEQAALDAQIKAAENDQKKAEFEIKINSLKKQTVDSKSEAEQEKTSSEFQGQNQAAREKKAATEQREHERKLQEEQRLEKNNPGQAMIDAATGGTASVPIRYGGPSGFAAERIKTAEDDIRDHGANAGNAHELESAVESLHNTIKTTMGPASAQAKTLATVVQKIKQIEQTLANHNEATKNNRAGGS